MLRAVGTNSNNPISVPRIAFLETSLMRFRPAPAWRAVLKRLDIPSDSARVLSGSSWKTGALELGGEVTAFKARIAASTGVEPLSLAEKVTLTELPPASQFQVRQCAELYRGLLAAPENAYLPSRADLRRPSHGVRETLVEVNPYVARALAATHAERLKTKPGRPGTIAGSKIKLPLVA